jgi:hypothetical protein
MTQSVAARTDLPARRTPPGLPRLRVLEQQLSAWVGAPVSITLRGERSFTFSTDDADPVHEERLRDFFASYRNATITAQVDAECGTHVYVDLAPETVTA